MRSKGMKMKFMMVGLLAAGSLVMGQKVKSAKEAEAVQGGAERHQLRMQKIAAVDNLLSKFKDTEFKAIALEMAGEAYQQKGDSRERHRLRKSRARSRSQKLPGHAAGFRTARADHQGIRPG